MKDQSSVPEPNSVQTTEYSSIQVVIIYIRLQLGYVWIIQITWN